MGKGSKNGDSDQIKFFRIEEGGEITSAVPGKEKKDKDESSFAPMEPVFKPPATEEDVLEPAQMKSEPTEAFLEEQIQLLQPEIDDIARLPGKQALSGDQVEVLRKYLSLKEAEVRDLRDQQRQYQAFLKKVAAQLEGHARKNRDLLAELESVKRREEVQRAELRDIKDRHHEEVVRIKSDYEEKLAQSGNYESQVDDFMKKREEWQDRVREDLKRIKLKERELENKYELLKRDTQALLDSKDKHVLELKKKNDALELEMESLEDRLRKGNSILGSIDSKKRRLVETMKLAISLLEEIDSPDQKADTKERKAG